jgi:CheY-like chemotaxis protein
VLCVEDQPRLRKAIEASLRELGFEPLMAADPREAFALIDGGPAPAALLTDLMLPHLSGIELAERIEAAVPGIAVLFMSGNPSDVLDARRAKGKPVAFLAKPFTLEALGAAIRDAIDAAD